MHSHCLTHTHSHTQSQTHIHIHTHTEGCKWKDVTIATMKGQAPSQADKLTDTNRLKWETKMKRKKNRQRQSVHLERDRDSTWRLVDLVPGGECATPKNVNNLLLVKLTVLCIFLFNPLWRLPFILRYVIQPDHAFCRWMIGLGWRCYDCLCRVIQSLIKNILLQHG